MVTGYFFCFAIILFLCAGFFVIDVMLVIESSKDLEKVVEGAKRDGKCVGFVPTMGALHEGHLSLVNEADRMCDFVVVSIFVNPNQFNNKEDLVNYPRTLDRDAGLLSEVACDVIFAPTVTEVYPEPDQRVFDFGRLETVMEGQYRPGHFNGVAQVVSRLFELVSPDKAFFGEKDFQQLAIIRSLVRKQNYPIQIVGCPIVRETDGLAMSSRNQLLSSEHRKIAGVIARTLLESCNFVEGKSVLEVVEYVKQEVETESLLKVEYFDVVDGDSLQSVNEWRESEYIVGCIAVFAGKVRLIDNIVYKKLS